MLQADEKAIYLFNRALKQAIVLNIEPNKENAKFLALAELTAAKEFIYDLTLIDDLPPGKISKTSEYINKIQKTIKSL